jgi:hypothetical protein
MFTIYKCPNPICRGDAELVQGVFGSLKAEWIVRCQKCRMSGPANYVQCEALHAWNVLSRPDGGWISVEDRLPVQECSVLACDARGWMCIAQMINETSESSNLIWILSLDGTPVVISYWQPLPAIPNLLTDEPLTTPEMDVQQAVDEVIESLARLPDAIARVGEEVKEAVRQMLKEEASD